MSTVIINGASSTVRFRDGTDLQVVAGAVVTGLAPVPTLAKPAEPGVDVLGGTLLVSGGSVVGGNDPYTGLGAGVGAVADSCGLTISGGTITGGQGQLNGQPGLVCRWPTSAVAISGGSITGGAGGLLGGPAAVVSLDSGQSLTISGGTFAGGSPGGASLSLTLRGTAAVSITGGSFAGEFVLGLEGSSSLTFHGTGLAYSGGHVTGTLSSGDAIDVALTNLGASLTVGGTTTALTVTP